jgi:hypothetical protein
MLVFFVVVILVVALPIACIWAWFELSDYLAEKESTSFSAVYAEQQRQIKIKQIHRQALLVASQYKYEWQQTRAYKAEYKHLMFINNM